MTVKMKLVIVGLPAFFLGGWRGWRGWDGEGVGRSTKRMKHAYNATEANGSRPGSGLCARIISTQLVTLETFKRRLEKSLNNLI